MTDSSIARCAEKGKSGVLYRHSRTGETKLARAGESLPHRKGEGRWCPLAQDNLDGERLSIVIGRGLMWITEGAPMKQGEEINILYTGPDVAVVGNKKAEGKYRVTEMEPTTWFGKPAIHIEIEYLADMDPTKLVYVAGLANC